jgi:hypothetical protein
MLASEKGEVRYEFRPVPIGRTLSGVVELRAAIHAPGRTLAKLLPPVVRRAVGKLMGTTSGTIVGVALQFTAAIAASKLAGGRMRFAYRGPIAMGGLDALPGPVPGHITIILASEGLW